MKKDKREFYPDAPKAKKVRKKWSKKKKIIVFSSIIASFLVLLTVALCLYFLVFREKDYEARKYNSIDSFRKANCELILSDNVYLDEYDVNNDVFVTYSTYYEGNSLTEIALYGLCSSTEEYFSPRYTSIIAIRGDYAIVTKTSESGFSEGVYYVGVIRFRGQGITSPVLLTDFKMEWNSSNTDQIYFCGEYICVQGDLEYPSSQASFTTFYEYKSHDRLLEVFRIRCGYDSSTQTNFTIMQYDNYVVAYTSEVGYFFDITKDCFNGYLEQSETGSFSPFSVLGSDSESSYNKSIGIYYMGNGWFMRYASLSSSSAFEGYGICYFGTDLMGEATLTFARTKSDFYNVDTGNVRSISQLSAVIGVVNEYTYSGYASLASEYNSTTYTEESGRLTYEMPCYNPTDMVDSGYSYVYYYYRPYIDQLKEVESQGSEYASSLGEMTYCILDKNMQIVMPETLYPVLYVDGNGIEISDPEFTVNYGDAVMYKKDGTKIVLRKEDDKYSYATSLVNRYGVIVTRLEKANTEEGEEVLKYGAYATNGKIIVDCEYDELTAFYGGYAVGTKKKNDIYSYYRIDTLGNVEVLENVYAVKDGIYIFISNGKKGVKNFAGEILIEGKYDAIFVSDNYMVDGVFQKTYVGAVSGNKTFIYKLEE